MFNKKATLREGHSFAALNCAPRASTLLR